MKRYAPLLLALILLGAAAVAPSTSAASPSSAALTVPQLSLRDAEPEEDEGEESEYEECRSSAEEFEFEEEEEFEEVEESETEEECGEEAGKGTFVTAPPACRVRRAESSITTLAGSDRVRLTVRYLTYSPAVVTVSMKLKDHKGTLSIEHTTKHLGAKGVLHLTTKVGDAVMERVAKAKEFDISLRAANTPGYCGPLLEQHLRSKQPTG